MGQENIVNTTHMEKYKAAMREFIPMIFPNVQGQDLEDAMNASIEKRYKQTNVSVVNTHKNKRSEKTLLEVTNYIHDRQPITTAYGTMFRNHAKGVSPLAHVITSFLNNRDIDKAKMFKYPKGSEEYEHYNLAQLLDKRDTNSIYGNFGLCTSIIYNIHVAGSITSQGRALTSSAGMLFESFLANSVKFGGLNEVIDFITNVKSQRYKRKFRDWEVLDKDVNDVECFSKLVLTCGFNYIPSEEDLDIIWTTVCRLSQEDKNRVYYKNNLYEFLLNKRLLKLIDTVLRDLDGPYLVPTEPPENIKPMMDEFRDLLVEYVYYPFMYIDRIDKMDRGIKSVCVLSDTDSTIISLDAWFHFVLEEVVKGDETPYHLCELEDAIEKLKFDEFGDRIDDDLFTPVEHEMDYDFVTDTIIDKGPKLDEIPSIYPSNNLRYTIISMMSYVLTYLINDYMLEFTKRTHSYRGDQQCRIYMKNEF